jgi:hypothetical protein
MGNNSNIGYHCTIKNQVSPIKIFLHNSYNGFPPKRSKQKARAYFIWLYTFRVKGIILN